MRFLAILILRVKTLANLFGVQLEAHWSALDSRNLSNFLLTQSGTRFLHQIRNMAIQATLGAPYAKGGSDYARAYQDCFQKILRLSALDPQRLVEPGHVSLTDKQDEEKAELEAEEPSSSTVWEGSTIGY